MKIERQIQQNLIDWKNSSNRKPLIVQGARQVGKTWLLKTFGREEFENFAYFNFEEQPELKQFFSTSKDVSRIIQNLSLVFGKAISPGKTLIIFDEIQECNDALNSLKYFCENAPEYAVVSAGSLLGITLSRGASFPVGKVDFLTVYPLSFNEFLLADDHSLASYLDQIDKIVPIPDIFFNRLIEKFKMFFISGGMPEAVVALLEGKDVGLTQQVLSNILKAYMLDFSKHIENKDIPKLGYIWSSIPSQLARENKKFLYQTVKTGARAREYEDSLLWLSQAGLVYRVFRNTKPALPLTIYDDLSAFKIYLLDVGLLRRLSLLDPVAIKEGNRLFVEFKGALSENYVLQSLIHQFENPPRYWTSGNKAEIDFIIQYENSIIPVEVKSDNSVKGKSLSLYNKEFQPEIRIRYSLKNLKTDDRLLNIPLFMADRTRHLIDLALNQSTYNQ
jgi:predicted AAA+ superfamily ATPase